VGDVIVDIPWTERAIGKEEVALLLAASRAGCLSGTHADQASRLTAAPLRSPPAPQTQTAHRPAPK